MKILIKTLLIAFLVASCNSDVKRDSYVINGNAKGIYNGIRVYLRVIDPNNRPMDIDTAVVMNEKFKFEGKVLGPEMCFLFVNSVNGNLPLIIENSEINIDIDKDNLSASKVYGTKTLETLNEYNAKMNVLLDKRKDISIALRIAAQNNDNEKTTALNKEFSELNTEITNSPINFIQNNSSNFYSLILMETMVRRKNVELNKITDMYNGLDEVLKTSSKGKEVAALIDTAQKMLEAEARTEIGKIAPEFSAPTPEGKLLSLSEVRGKVTLIDFWAAWCGPCRRENPNLVNIYNKYHDKGLEIIGVSLDGFRQEDPKAAWIKAIEDDKLTWPQVSNLQYFGPIANLYNVKAIPASFILDAEGKIVAKKLRGPALEEKIAELLNQ